MAESVTFALILSKNIGVNNAKSILKMPQVEVEVTVKAGMDPYTLQEMRDAISPSFLDRRKTLNSMIESAEKALFAEKVEKKRKALAKVKLKEIDSVITKFEANLIKRVNDFCADQEKKQKDFEKDQVKFAVSCVWSLGNVLKDTVGGIVALFSGAGIPAASLAAAKTIVDLALDMKGLISDLRDVYKSGADVQSDIVSDLKKIKAIKPPATVGKSLTNNLAKNIELYEKKMDAAEMQAKALAKKADTFLKFANKRDDLSKEAEKRIAKVVDSSIKEVQRISTDIKKAQRSLQSFQAKHANAEKVAKKDAASFISWALEVYDMANKIYGWYEDLGEADKAIDMLVTYATKDDFFAPVQIDF
ncbi:MAG: hypothetical protein P8O10_13130 [Pseudorhodobacter sp.]|nr:hypothetical protein [Pseudorhodobacter sp.]